MEQIIEESGIKGSSCSKEDCSLCDNIQKCYQELISVSDKNEEIDYGGYETETHYF